MIVTPRKESFSLYSAIELPHDFRANDILAFHRRDPFMAAERVDGNTLQKGLVWEGLAACLTIRFYARHADVELAIDGSPCNSGVDSLENMVRRMLGLTQRIEDFEKAYRAHLQLGPLIARNPGLRVPLSATPFEALIWAVTAQQISVKAAVSLRRRLIEASGLKHSGGLHCHPDAGQLARLSQADLRLAGFSRAKAQTLIALSQKVQENEIPLDAWIDTLPVDRIREQLLLLRGIGPWTVDYTLLRGFGWLDGSLHGDAGVRCGLQSLLGCSQKITEEHAKRWLAELSPWRALVAAHLWALCSSKPVERRTDEAISRNTTQARENHRR